MNLSKIFFICMLLFIWCSISDAGSSGKFRKAIFLHHSTGGCIWGPNGGTTTVPAQITSYNSSKGFSGIDLVTMNEQGWPTVWNNEWERWHKLFENRDTDGEDIRPFFTNYETIIIKSCFPSSNMSGYGSPADTNNPTKKSIYNYKWHWRHIIKAMAQHPENFFVIWTNAPNVAGATNNTEARLSHEFCKWAKDTLAQGLDPAFGAFPHNVFVFDFFHKLVDGTWKLPLSYASSSGDSHPNGSATNLVAPLFVQETYNAALLYETIFPVEITSFTSEQVDRRVILRWTTATEINNYGFEVEKSVVSRQGTVGSENNPQSEFTNPIWSKAGFVCGSGNSNSPKEYFFIDSSLLNKDEEIQYRLKQIDFDGAFEYYPEIAKINFRITGIEEKQLLEGFILFQNYPNPFNPSTKIKYIIPAKVKGEMSNVELAVYDMLGRKITTLVNEEQSPGKYEVVFSAGDCENGSKLASGVYIYKLTAGEYGKSRKFILMK